MPGPLSGLTVRDGHRPTISLVVIWSANSSAVDRPAVVPDEEAAESNLLPSQVRIAEKYGGGYIANVEGLHHLHCLVRARQPWRASLHSQ